MSKRIKKRRTGEFEKDIFGERPRAQAWRLTPRFRNEKTGQIAGQIQRRHAGNDKTPGGARPRGLVVKQEALTFSGLHSGSSGGTRTPDRVVNSHLLYRLSYRGIKRSSKNAGWGTGIRTPISGVRVRCLAIRPSPNAMATRFLGKSDAAVKGKEPEAHCLLPSSTESVPMLMLFCSGRSVAGCSPVRTESGLMAILLPSWACSDLSE